MFRPLIKGLFLIAALLLTETARADDTPAPQTAVQPAPSKEEKIRQILKILDQEHLLTKAYETVIPQMVNSYKQRYPTMTIAQVEELVKTIRENFQAHAEEIYGLTIDAWNNTFSNEEVDAYYSFVTSPAGASFTSKSKELSDTVGGLYKTFGTTVLAPALANAIKADERLAGIR